MNKPFFLNLIMIGLSFMAGLSYPRWQAVVGALIALLLAVMFSADVDDPWLETVLTDDKEST